MNGIGAGPQPRQFAARQPGARGGVGRESGSDVAFGGGDGSAKATPIGLEGSCWAGRDSGRRRMVKPAPPESDRVPGVRPGRKEIAIQLAELIAASPRLAVLIKASRRRKR
jgi:hypothetical protein